MTVVDFTRQVDELGRLRERMQVLARAIHELRCWKCRLNLRIPRWRHTQRCAVRRNAEYLARELKETQDRYDVLVDRHAHDFAAAMMAVARRPPVEGVQ